MFQSCPVQFRNTDIMITSNPKHERILLSQNRGRSRAVKLNKAESEELFALKYRKNL